MRHLISGLALRDFACDCVSRQDAVGKIEVDIRLGSNYWKEKVEPRCTRVHVMKKDSWEDLWEKKPILDTGIVLQPGEFILAETAEYFQIPDDVYGVLTLRSWAAKSGLDQSSSLTLKPGWSGFLIMELHNGLKWHDLLIEKGEMIGQIQFFRV